MCIRKLKPIATHNCASKLGSPIYWVRNDTNYLMGLYMLGENCAIAEQAVVLYVYAHINWINSVINSTSSASLAVFIPSLKLTDECSYPDSTTGTCVSQTSCTSIYKRIESYLPIIYCNSRAIVCCPLEDVSEPEKKFRKKATCSPFYIFRKTYYLLLFVINVCNNIDRKYVDWFLLHW